MDEAIQKQLTETVNGDRVVLFMKGTRSFPQCGFSATVTQILDGLVSEYTTVNVLADGDVRQGIKEFSSWPTIPQLYVEGKFVGGCDIIREMFLAGELHGLLGVEDKLEAPTIEVTAAARAAFEAALAGEKGALRLEISARFEYGLAVDAPKTGDFEVDAGGLTLLIDRGSAARASGTKIDYSEVGEGGFKIDNPNEPPRVKDMSVHELERLLKDDAELTVIDVRPQGERDIAKLDAAIPLDGEGEKLLQDLPKDAMVVFMCHHGGRSQGAAERYLQMGFTRIYNLQSGIDAWSRQIDDRVARY